jgi:hypothetical protein
VQEMKEFQRDDSADILAEAIEVTLRAFVAPRRIAMHLLSSREATYILGTFHVTGQHLRVALCRAGRSRYRVRGKGSVCTCWRHTA